MNQAYDGMMKELPSEVQKAVITYKHELTPSFKYIAEWRKRREAEYVWSYAHHLRVTNFCL